MCVWIVGYSRYTVSSEEWCQIEAAPPEYGYIALWTEEADERHRDGWSGVGVSWRGSGCLGFSGYE